MKEINEQFWAVWFHSLLCHALPLLTGDPPARRSGGRSRSNCWAMPKSLVAGATCRESSPLKEPGVLRSRKTLNKHGDGMLKMDC